ncbi:class I adenylate-forming enzyme family protein [Streptomyces gilvus]|uniref:class I adenylate-forming enzyme family protein n=1 Tax=Streptomyces gilvus TaxID=2920937 RepID=UPI001F0EA85E|nr:AMP-binding protein [Streptomyces sp. CME 23]MCH5675615.1 AMP-binding protein [Streptomyces sp. CME 23]
MAAEGMPDRIAVGSLEGGITYAQLLDQARRTASYVRTASVGETPVGRLAMVDLNSDTLPVLLFGASFAGVPFVPMNYRLADDKLRELVARNAPALLVVDPPVAERIGDAHGLRVLTRSEFGDQLAELPAAQEPADDAAGDEDVEESIAVLLFTSGTTGAPKAAVLRNRHLASYILSTAEFGAAGEHEATLVSVPPYHIAGVSAILSAVYSGRRLVYLPAFKAGEWVRTARDERITHAMVVPTMLGRILDVLEADGTTLPALTNLSCGGGPMPVAVIERALRLLPHVDFVNAYGLTETSSTISLLTPEDHRAAISSDDPAVRARLRSVGRPLPGLELEIRDAAGEPVAVGEPGEVWVRGGQVAGEYLGAGGGDQSDGWFPTRDSGYLDAEGYLFLSGRLDDVIVRGGENISPGEIEEVLIAHPAVREVAVVGATDVRWGERVVAYVVPSSEVTEEQLQEHVRVRLRSTCTPEQVHFVDTLPYNETGKLLRRVLREKAQETANV